MTNQSIEYTVVAPEKWAITPSISKLNKATHTLTARHQGLTEFTFTSDFAKVTKLDLSKNQFSELILDIDMPELEFLDISYNQTSLKKVIFKGNFPKLKYLYLYESQLEHIEFHQAIPALEILNLGKNALTEINLPHGFEELVSLYLNDNQIKSVGIDANTTFQNNNERVYPLNPANFPKLAFLNLQENPLEEVSEEIIADENCLEAYRNFFISTLKSKLIYLHQAKMILVGNGEVGKTSIRLKLLDRNAILPTKEERTPGLDISTYSLKDLPPQLTQLREPIDFDLHIWDFGGQGKYREVQQLFCSRKSLYIFVTSVTDESCNEDYVNFDYWLAMAQTYGYDKATETHSPIIPVCNKIDEEAHGFHDFDETKQYKNIPANLIKISCKHLTNFEHLVTSIRQTLPKVSSDIFTDRYTQNWLNVKDTLETRQQEHYISRSEYLSICTTNDLDEGEAQNWLGILGRIGTVIHFGNNEALKDWIILDPNWVKNAIYKIIDEAESIYFVKDGTLKPQHLKAIWKEYSDVEQEKLLALILEFKLCYANQTITGDLIYIFPALLGDAPNIAKVPKLQKLSHHVRFNYPKFIPAGTVNKLMVSLNTMIYNNLKWKNGFVIEAEDYGAYAVIQENWEAKHIDVKLYGANFQPLVDTIMQQLQLLNENLKRTKLLSKLNMTISFLNQFGSWISLKETTVEASIFGGDTRGLGHRRPKTPKPKITIPKVDSTPKPPRPEGEKRKILFLAANPFIAELNISNEYRRIKNEMLKGSCRDDFEWLNPEFSVTIPSLLRAFDQMPHIIHFSGHGLKRGIVISDINDNETLIPTRALKRLFKRVQNVTEIVLLNSCYSAAQAKIISSYGMYVIGNNDRIGDDAAIGFAQGLYTGLSEGKKFEDAFDDAMFTLEVFDAKYADVIEVWKDGEQLDLL